MSICEHLRTVGIDVEGIRQLLRAGIDPNISEYKGKTPLHILASTNVSNPQDEEKSVQVAKDLIAFEANVDIVNHKRRTPLMQAVIYGNWRMVELLLQANANINCFDIKRNTAMHHAVLRCCRLDQIDGDKRVDFQILEGLLKCNPLLEVVNLHYETPLMIAVLNKELKTVQCLLKNNASVNFRDYFKASAMHYAFYSGVNVDILYELLRHGGEFGIRNSVGETPIDVYIRDLITFASDKVEKIKKVFKIFIFHKNTLRKNQKQDVETISREKNCQLSRFIEYCTDETKKMLTDEIAPNYCVYDMALRGFLKESENDNIAFDVYDEVLDKIVKGEYSIYYDLILDGIYFRYLKKQFAAMCGLILDPAIEFLNFDIRFQLSDFLSPLEMFSMMVACLAENTWDLNFPYFKHGSC